MATAEVESGYLVELWNRANAWLKINAESIAPLLLEGASDDEIKELERKVNLTLPADFKASYRIHNGFDGGYFFGSVHGLNSFLTLEEIASHFEQGPQNENAGENVARNWNRRWIPFGKDRKCNAVCVDQSFNASKEKCYGRVIQCYANGSSFVQLASSFTDFLKKFVDDLENNQFELSEGEGINLIGLNYKGCNGQ